MPVWLTAGEVRYFQRQLMDEHGGLHGIRDQGALESTLARPMQLLNYKPEAQIHELAASYGFGLVKNHVFNDGNKRIALAVMDTFLRINGAQLTAEEVDAVYMIREVASSVQDETALADWIKNHSMSFDLEEE